MFGPALKALQEGRVELGLRFSLLEQATEAGDGNSLLSLNQLLVKL